MQATVTMTRASSHLDTKKSSSSNDVDAVPTANDIINETKTLNGTNEEKQRKTKQATQRQAIRH